MFGLGFGLPLLILAFVARQRQGWLLSQFQTHYNLIGRLSGLLLVVVAAWAFFAEWESFLLYWS